MQLGRPTLPGKKAIEESNLSDENFVLKHDERGIISMVNSGPNTNSNVFKF